MTVHDVAARLPGIADLQRRCQAVAMLDAILSPEWESRRYSYTAEWGDGASATEIRDGSGNDCFIVFTPDGVFIKGFDHESPMAPGRDGRGLWPGLVDGVPDVFVEYLTEPAFLGFTGVLSATFCIWRQPLDSGWQTGPVAYPGLEGRSDPDGAHDLLDLLTDPTPQSYRDFARSYFEVEIDPATLEHIYQMRPLTDQVVQQLNPAVTLGEIADEIADAGYPTG